MSPKSEKPSPKFVVPTTVEVPYGRIADLLTGALEGGSNYWIDSVKKTPPDEWLFLSDPELGRKPGEKPCIWLPDYVLNPEGRLVFTINEPFETDDNGKDRTRYILDFDTVKTGLETFLKGEGWGKNEDGTPKINMRHAADFLAEHDDADTSDVFLQICLFGKTIFG